MRQVHRIALTLFLVMNFGAAAIAVEPDAPQQLITRADGVRMAVQSQLAEKFKVTTEHRKDEQGALVEYYSNPEQRLLWVDENGITSRGKAVMAEIRRADDYGLRAADYKLPDADAFGSAGNPTDWLAHAEIKISFAVLDYAHHARGGRIEPQKISKNLDPSLALPNPAEVIESIAIRSDPATYLRSFQPNHPQFEALRQKLIELRGGKTEKVKEVVRIPDGPTLKLGVEDSQVALLRQRLDIPAGENENLYDETVLAAVRQFQTDHGTHPDGMVGPGTRRELNEPHKRDAGTNKQARIKAILLNMERWRWLPQDLGAFYITANIPEFTLRVFKEDEVVHSTRIVVGKTNTQTPIFSNEMRTLVFGPYWHVPNSIKVGEIRPYLRQEASWFFGGGGWNTGILQRQGLRVRYGGREIDPRSLDWDRIDIRSLEIYQPPGPTNVLGKVKFMFPNKHDVYLHDTTQKHLFSKQVRAESHGCVRVQNPDQLASIIMKRDQDWSPGRTRSALDNSYNNQIALREMLPVYLTYFTLKVNEDGSFSSFGDLYGHDTRMAAALRL
jgi:L,D-transpeptidase YcbB